VADRRLASDPVAATIREMLDGLTLEEAATLPDQIKGWDKTAPGKPHAFRMPDHPDIQKQLEAFWRANPPTGNDPVNKPNHHWFHYTDIPVHQFQNHETGHVGQPKWDVVNMIAFCVKVLKGTEPEDNERKITKPVAVILLSHYVGDIHQPLHVGAAYFDKDGKAINPDRQSGVKFFDDEGGNKVLLTLTDASHHEHTEKLHGYWDSDTVETAKMILREEATHGRAARRVSDEEIAQRLASHAPAGWDNGMNADLTTWSETWANEIMPVAAEAHARLEFFHFHAPRGGGTTATLSAEERHDPPGQESYEEWAGKVVRKEIHLAGWRLAAMLKEALR
jgi:hypothetical protein